MGRFTELGCSLVSPISGSRCLGVAAGGTNIFDCRTKLIQRKVAIPLRHEHHRRRTPTDNLSNLCYGHFCEKIAEPDPRSHEAGWVKGGAWVGLGIGSQAEGS